MALDQGAIADLLDALRAGGDLDVIREGLALVLQALIEAEAAQQIGAGRYQPPRLVLPIAMDRGRGCCRPRPAMSSYASPSCERGPSSPHCVGATPPHRPGIAGGDHGGLCARHLHPQG
jgi:hypothetical protein